MHRVILGCGINDTPATNSTEFSCPFSRVGMGPNETTTRTFVVPVGMTIHTLRVLHGDQQDAGNTIITVRLDAADTTLTVTIVDSVAAGVISNTADRFHANAGQGISLTFVSGSGVTAALVVSYVMMGDLDG